MKVVRARGLEPPLLAEPDPKSGASAIPPRPLGRVRQEFTLSSPHVFGSD